MAPDKSPIGPGFFMLFNDTDNGGPSDEINQNSERIIKGDNNKTAAAVAPPKPVVSGVR